MKESNIQLQLATLKKEYLQNILFPEVIILKSQKTKKNNEYSETYKKLDEGIKNFAGYSHLNQPSPT